MKSHKKRPAPFALAGLLALASSFSPVIGPICDSPDCPTLEDLTQEIAKGWLSTGPGLTVSSTGGVS